MDGWIKLNRSIQSHWMWQDEPFDKARAFIDLILLANFEDKKTVYKGEIIVCKRGDVNLSINQLAERWKWSRHKVSDFLNLLEKDKMVEQKRTTTRTVITIVNYGVYQDSSCDEGQPTDNLTDNKRTSKGQLTDTTKNIKNDKNIKEISPKGDTKKKSEAQFVPPTVDEVRAYCKEMGYGFDPEYFVAYHTSKGWVVGNKKMKSWKSACTTFEINRKKWEGEKNGNTTGNTTSYEDECRESEQKYKNYFAKYHF